MLVLEGRNVNNLYRKGWELLDTRGVRQGSRAGAVRVHPTPVCSVYYKPTERVLWSPVRDANPFFHLLESMWMLAGRQDSEFLNEYVKDFGERFAESSGLLHGAYGARWRHHWEIDQVEAAVRRLRRDANDRRSVIAMWDPTSDLNDPADIDESTGQPWVEPKDIPCNTHIHLRVNVGRLDLTVYCRSNDIIWGAYGANAVHFSILQEYMAAGIGCEVGAMYQVSNNYHAYENILRKIAVSEQFRDPYLNNMVLTPLVTDYPSFKDEVIAFCKEPLANHRYKNKFLYHTAHRMAVVNNLRKTSLQNALVATVTITADDWRQAAVDWLTRRMDKKFVPNKDGRDK